MKELRELLTYSLGLLGKLKEARPDLQMSPVVVTARSNDHSAKIRARWPLDPDHREPWVERESKPGAPLVWPLTVSICLDGCSRMIRIVRESAESKPTLVK